MADYNGHVPLRLLPLTVRMIPTDSTAKVPWISVNRPGITPLRTLTTVVAPGGGTGTTPTTPTTPVKTQGQLWPRG